MRVQLSWTKSVSLDVVSQELTYTINGAAGQVSLAANLEKYVFIANEGDAIDVSLKAFNGKKLSDPAMGSFEVPVIKGPSSPTNLVFEVLADE